jgi:hypothetical protein
MIGNMLDHDSELHDQALQVLLQATMSSVVKARNWNLLKEVARLACEDAPTDLTMTDPDLFRRWREAVTAYHLRGWTNMTPQRVQRLIDQEKQAKRTPA